MFANVILIISKSDIFSGTVVGGGSIVASKIIFRVHTVLVNGSLTFNGWIMCDGYNENVKLMLKTERYNEKLLVF